METLATYTERSALLLETDASRHLDEPLAQATDIATEEPWPIPLPAESISP